MASRASPTFAPTGATGLIKLQNPVSQSFAPFIVGNSRHCERVVEENSAVGQHVVICGAGPSLAEEAAGWCPKGDQVWGCNSAGPWLYKHGYKPTHFLTVDQTPEMLVEWKTAPDVEYMVATSIHPHLTQYLLSKGRRLTWFHNFVGIPPESLCDDCKAKGEYTATACHACQSTNISKHHGPVGYGVCTECNETTEYNAPSCPKCGSDKVYSNLMDYENWVYSALFPSTVMAGSGLNTVSRAIDVATYMGFDQITVLGADCAIRVKSPRPESAVLGSPEHRKWLEEETVMHADGGSALASGASPVTLSAVIDEGTDSAKVRRGKGRHWETKVDLMITAVWLMQLEKRMKGRLRLVGDTLPRALRKKNQAYIMRLPTLIGSDGRAITCAPK